LSMLFASFYLNRWRMPPVFLRGRRPVSKWGRYVDTLPSIDDVYRMYREAGERPNVAVATGPYQAGDDEKRVVVDIDAVSLSEEEKRGVERALAREGFVVVDTPRGMHLHFKTRDEVYALTLNYERRHVGEGAGLQPHLWTSPPSVRPLGGGDVHVYRFVLPDGRATAKYSSSLAEAVELKTMSLAEASMVLEGLLGVTLRAYRPGAAQAGAPPAPRPAGHEPESRRPIFFDMQEFHARVFNFPLPTPVARILYAYYTGLGLETLAAEVAAKNPAAMQGPVPHGSRFLAAAEYVLFVTHLVANVRWDELVEPLRYGITDWPEDEGARLDRKLSYLLLFSDDGYVYPRYGGLGALRPLGLCNGCPWSYMCDKWGAKPWKYVRRLYDMMMGLT